ncbi:phage tail tape measure protein [Candidatus Termititenax aidoneus]|uniref:Phage tail tape measure protein n=1 Tax=Termititenax aidoneus TaxID=2218524 RepID=A0A388TDZ9_TERA1|nr:phage tail tape measure protein [Candidatus Termititenax aidoneus]
MVDKQANVDVNVREGKTNGKAVDSLSKLAQNFLAIKQAAQAVWSGVKNLISAFQEQEKASAKLTQALKNQGIYTEKTQKEIEDYSSALQQASLFGDELITNVQAGLVTVGLQGDELQRVTQATLDFAAATGMDLVSAGKLMEKAMSGNLSMLSRYGIQAKTTADAIQQLEGRYGGMAQAIANTPTGKLVQLANNFGDFKEMLGQTIITAIEPFVAVLNKLFVAFGSAPTFIKSFIGIITVLLITVAGAIPVLGAFGIALSAAIWPITLAVGAVALLGAGYVALKNDADLSKKSIEELNDAIEAEKEKIEKYKDYLESNKKALKWSPGTQHLKDQVEGYESAITTSEKRIIQIQETIDEKALEENRAKLTAERAERQRQEIEAEQQKQEVLKEMAAVKNEQDAEQAASDFEKLTEQKQNEIDLASLTYEQIKLLADKNSKFKEELEKRDLENTKKINEQRLNNFKDTLAFMSQGMQSSSKEVFAIGKASAIAQATISTYEAVGKALASAPPPFNFALGAAALAVGLDNVARINQTQMQLAEGGTFTAMQPTFGQLGGQPIEFGEAGAEQVTFQPLENGNDSGEGQKCYIVIEGSSGDTLIEALYYKTKDWERRSGLS